MSVLEKHASTALALVVTSIAIAAVRKKWCSRNPPYPPGPKGYPIIGNVFDFPENPIWEGFARMSQEHSERTAFESVVIVSREHFLTRMNARYRYFVFEYDGFTYGRAEQH